MRRVMFTLALLALLALILPAAKADTVNLNNQWGTVTILNSGITSKQSELMSYNGITPTQGHSLGYVNFSTGALISGDVLTGGVFSSVGSVFDVLGNGNYGSPHGNIFTGAFVGDISWTVIATGPHNLYHEYELQGTVGGDLKNGQYVTGKTTQYIYTYWNQEKVDHQGNIKLGTLSITPEPGTLGLLGIGLMLMAGMFRRKALTL